jgi:hypothetical protein
LLEEARPQLSRLFTRDPSAFDGPLAATLTEAPILSKKFSSRVGTARDFSATVSLSELYNALTEKYTSFIMNFIIEGRSPKRWGRFVTKKL